MRFAHLSDLHIGKRVNEYSMLEDQKYILAQVLDIIHNNDVNAVIIAGDVYDKPIPPREAVALFDDFLVKLADRNLPVFIISGNHDSPERIAFGGRLMLQRNVFISPVYDGSIESIELNDDYGKINISLLPFIKPAHVRRYFPEVEINSYTDAVKTALDNTAINPDERNIIVTHQFVTGADRTESEDISVGGADNVDVSVFDVFDYVALGHIHRSQKCGRETVRYCGTPLKYSFSEAKDKKSVTIVELKEKGNISLEYIPLTPLHDMVEIKGTYEQLMSRSFYEGTSYCTDYVHITLTNENDVPEAIGRLRSVYTNLMKLDYDNIRTRTNIVLNNDMDARNTSPFDMFADFFSKQNGGDMTEEQSELISELIEKVWEGER